MLRAIAAGVATAVVAGALWMTSGVVPTIRGTT
jgi:hypothetical protein